MAATSVDTTWFSATGEGYKALLMLLTNACGVETYWPTVSVDTTKFGSGAPTLTIGAGQKVVSALMFD